MNDFRSFYNEKEKNTESYKIFHGRKSDSEKKHVAMFSDFFCSLPNNMFYTNSMYADFRDELIATIDVFDTKENVIVDVYELDESEADKREMALIGFRKYIHEQRAKLSQQYHGHLAQISFFAVLGLIFSFVAYGLSLNLTAWITFCLNTIGSVLLWQFVGYWAFQYSGEKRELDRLKQIESIEFCFKKWE